MKTPVIILLTIGLVVFFTQCSKNKQSASTGNAEAAVPAKDEKPSTGNQKEVLPVNINRDYKWPGSTDAFTVVSGEVAGDVLTLQVQYSGGCEDHVFTMNSNLLWMKSMPPQLHLYLEHNSHGDMCRALITRTLSFDISGCQWEGQKEIRLIVNQDREKMYTYKY